MNDDVTYTKPEDFLGDGATIVLPSGKIIYASEPGIYKVQLMQVANVTWTHYDPSDGSVIGLVVNPSGWITPKITNSFLGKYDEIAYVEYDTNTRPDVPGGTTYRAELNHTNFDAAPLEVLPSKDSFYAVAKKESDKANLAIKAANGNWLDKLFYDLFGISKEKGLLYTAGGYMGFSYIRKKIAK